jgi:hypothetical protein
MVSFRSADNARRRRGAAASTHMTPTASVTHRARRVGEIGRDVTSTWPQVSFPRAAHVKELLGGEPRRERQRLRIARDVI